jgi:hypothetical protein
MVLLKFIQIAAFNRSGNVNFALIQLNLDRTFVGVLLVLELGIKIIATNGQ